MTIERNSERSAKAHRVTAKLAAEAAVYGPTAADAFDDCAAEIWREAGWADKESCLSHLREHFIPVPSGSESVADMWVMEVKE